MNLMTTALLKSIKFEAIVGYPTNEVIGKTVGQALPEFGENWFKISKSVTQTKQWCSLSFVLKKSTGIFLISAFNLSVIRLSFYYWNNSSKKAKDAFRLHEILFENAGYYALY